VDSNKITNQIEHHFPSSPTSQTSITSFNQLPKFTTANKLLVKDKLCIEYNTKKKKQKQIVELILGDKICIVKPHTDLVCDIIVRGILPKRHNGLESPTVYVLIADNKFDFYNITEIANKYQILDRVLENVIVKRIFTIYQLADSLIMDLEKDIKKYNSKLFIITGDFFLYSDSQVSKEEKDWLYPQMIKAITTIKDSIILVFSPTKLPGLINYT
jgi:hypothetical protein